MLNKYEEIKLDAVAKYINNKTHPMNNPLQFIEDTQEPIDINVHIKGNINKLKKELKADCYIDNVKYNLYATGDQSNFIYNLFT